MSRILLIDDTPEIAELLSFSLRDRGYHVTSSGFTTDVNELIAREHAAALVIDCSVYAMSESTFDMVRAHTTHAALPVVIISDTPEQADASLRERQAENVLLIPKPFTASQVARALDQLLSQPTTG